MVFIIAFIFANYIGFQISKFDEVNIIQSFIFLIILLLLAFILKKLHIQKFVINNPVSLSKKKNNFLIIFFMLFVIYFVASLIFFPGIYAYDTTAVLSEWKLGYLYSNQPAIYTLFVGSLLETGYFLFKSYQIAAYFVTFIQLCIFALCNAYALSFIFEEFKMNKIIKIIILIGFALMPFNSILSVSITKDVLFSGMYIVLIVLMLKIIYFNQDSYKLYLLIGIINCLLIMLRKNMLIVSLFFLVVLLFAKLKGKISVIITISISLVISIFVSSCIDTFFRKSDFSLYETLSIPMSQLARASIEHYDEFSFIDKEMVYKIWGNDELYRQYNPYLSDMIKLPNYEFLLNDKENLALYFKWWIKVGLKYPKEYIESFLCQNIGSWYMLDKTHSEIYDIKYYDGKQSSEFYGVYGYLQTFCFETDYPIYENSKIPIIRNEMVKIVSNNFYQKIPVLWLLFSPALYFWLLMLNLYFMRRNRKMRVVLLYVLLTWVSYLFGPCTLVRYMLPIINSSILISVFNLGISKEKLEI